MMICILAFSLCINVKAKEVLSEVTDDEKAVSYCCTDSNGSNSTVSYKPSEAPSGCSLGACKTCYCCSDSGNSVSYNQKSCGTGCSTTACPLTCCSKGTNVTTSGVSCPYPQRTGGCLTPTIVFSGVPAKLSDGDRAGIYAKVDNLGTGITLSVSSSANVVTPTKSGYNYIALIASNKTGKCQTVNIVATRKGDSTYFESTAKSDTIIVYPEWKDPVSKILPYSDNCRETYTMPQSTANKRGLNYYRINCVNEGHRCRCDVATRGCGIGDGESPHCYEDRYGYRYWGRYSGSGYTVVAGINSETACINGPTCTTTGPTPDSTSTACNGTGKLTENYEKNCKSPKGNYIYRIVCKDNVTTKFTGPVLDGNLDQVNNAYMAIGTGFKFTFNAKSNLKCNGEFSIDEYNAALKNFKNYRSKKIEDNPNQTDLMMGRAALSSFISEFALSYINWKPNYSLQADANILDYSGNTKMKSEAVNLLTSSSVTGTSAVSTCGNLPVGSADSSTGTVSFSKGPNFNYGEVHAIEKILPVAVLDKKGKIKYVTSESSVGTGETLMGRQFYITDNRDYLNSTNYNYRVEVSKLGFSHQSTDKTKCDIGILNNKVIYRHIDANDPFLQKTKTNRPIGYNWANSKLNFTKIIHTNVWSHSPDYTKITIDKSTALSIQGATRGNASYYIGACKRGQAKSGDIICTIIRNHRTTGA